MPKPIGFSQGRKLMAMRVLALTVCINLLALSCTTHQQSSEMMIADGQAKASTRLFRILQDKKFGFMDRSGKVVIKPQFDDAEDFSEGLALVVINRTKEFIDEAGKVVIVPKDFEPINGFTNGLARGNITNTSPYTKGYIDKSGKLVIDTKAMGACEFSEGLACVQTNKWGFIDPAGRYAIKPQFDEVSYFREGLATVTFWDQSKASHHKQGYLDKTGRIVIQAQFDVTQSFSEGLAAVGMKVGDDYQFGFITKTGTMVIRPQFRWTFGFHEGLAAVQVSEKWGYVDKNGALVIKPEFDKAEGFSEGLAAVAVNGKCGYIDRFGRFVIEPRFNEALAFTDGLAFVKVGGYDANAVNDVVGGFDAEGKWGYIDKAGAYIWQPTN
jgi:hypothetical protein